MGSMKNGKKFKRSGRPLYRFIKRTVDIIGALVGCVLLIPITIIIWMANLFSSDNGSVFYFQKRIGLNGKSFVLFKYRSMVTDADRILNKYLSENPDAKKEFEEFKKLKNDPRITPIGRFIRKSSLDEFPQFINVLKGDMSLVGPRPYLCRERSALGDAYNTIITVKPGLTGPWQVGGRNDIPFCDRVKLDVEYVNNLSILKDAKYLLGTFIELFRKRGAM